MSLELSLMEHSQMMRFVRCLAVLGALLFHIPATLAQDMTGLDTTSDAFTKSEMTRADIEAAIAKLQPGATLDLSGKSLNGLDLSGMDLRQVKLQSTRINHTNFKSANLEGVVLDQAWGLQSDFTGANLKKSSLFSSQFGGGKFDNADFSGAHVAADFTNASVTNANFGGADLSADEKNQSMGLMRGAFKSAKLDGSSFKNANLARVMMEYASLRGADLTNANLRGGEFAATDFTDADVRGANFLGADVDSAHIGRMKNAASALNLDKAKNRDRALD
jgi:BTB/POZ domain-containing protein KCTD9